MGSIHRSFISTRPARKEMIRPLCLATLGIAQGN